MDFADIVLTRRRLMARNFVTRLSKRTIDAIARPPSGYLIAWDARLKGFGVRVTAAGVISFIVNYRVNGIERRMTIGRYGVLSPDEARQLASKRLGEASEGVDPLREKQKLRQGTTFRQLAELYLERHAFPRKAPLSAREDQRKLTAKLIPALGGRRVDEIERTDVVRLHNEIRKQIGPYAANRYLALLGKMLSLAVEWGVRPVNPVRGVKPFIEEKRDRWLRPDEIRRMFEALSTEPNGMVRAALTFMLLTGCRKSEALNARWEDVDFEARTWRIPKTKAKKPQAVPLSGQALSVLQGVKRIEGCPWIFIGKSARTPLVNVNKPWARVRRLAGIPDVRIHDLRRSLGSMMVQSGATLYVAQRALRHADSRTTADVYGHLGDEPTRAAFEAVGEKVATLMRPPRTTSA
jgi:integrase